MTTEESGGLLDFVTSLTGERYLKVEEVLGDGYVRLRVSEAERRQAKHDIRSVEDVVVELLRNSRDANSSKIFVATYKEANLQRKISVIDDGWGIPPSVQSKIFEPRVTAKLDNVVMDAYGVHGRGMALYSVKSAVENVELVVSIPGKGSVFKVLIDTQKLPERKDQSTFPDVRVKNGQFKDFRGPHNIPRLLVEFGLEHPSLELYFGSPAEILATMFILTREVQSLTSPVRSPDLVAEILGESNLKFWQVCGLVSDARLLAFLAEKYNGLEISERNAHRILSGEIKPLQPISLELFSKPASKLTGYGEKIESKMMSIDNLSKHILDEDLQLLAQAAAQIFTEIGAKYFLRLSNNPIVKRDKNQLKILLTLEKDGEIW